MQNISRNAQASASQVLHIAGGSEPLDAQIPQSTLTFEITGPFNRFDIFVGIN
jgi:hypothetical protein